MKSQRVQPEEPIILPFRKAKEAPEEAQVTKPQKGILTLGQKKVINYFANGGASFLNLITFVNANFHFAEDIQENLDTVSNFYTKLATSVQGIIGTEDCWQKQNAVPMVGNALEVPIAIFSGGYNLWLFRGISQSLNQILRIIDQREVVDKNGNPKVVNNKVQIIGGDFSNGRGWIKGITTVFKEIPKIVIEIIQEPSRLQKFSHALTTASIFQFLGASIALTGATTFGAAVRDIAGAGVDFALMRDENYKTEFTVPKSGQSETAKRKGFNWASKFACAGLVWIGAETVDFLKRFDYFSEKISNLTNLSYFFDRGASTLLTDGNLSIET